MGCAQSIPSEHEYNLQAKPVGPALSEYDENIYEKVLCSPGRLEVPESFQKWFPMQHAHRNVSQLFKYRKKLGNGVTGSVFEIEYKSQICALKQIERNEECGRMLFTTECRVLSKLKHDGIITFIDMFYDEQYYYILLEKADYDLYQVMQRKGHLSESKTKKIIHSLLVAVSYLHGKNLAHRDLKPENIVFVASQSDHPRIIDFSDATIANDDRTYTEFVGTPSYMSPERLGEHNGSQLKKADIWAIGVIAFEMFTGQRCFAGDSQKEIFARVVRGEWSWPAHRTPSDAMQEFVEQCLCQETEQRLSANEALLHPWITTAFGHGTMRNRATDDDSTTSHSGPEPEGEHRLKLGLDDFSSSSQSVLSILNESHLVDAQQSRKMTGLYSIFEDAASMVECDALQQILIKGCVDKMSKNDLDMYKQQFEKLDRDHDGYVTGGDLVNAFTANGFAPNEATSLAATVMDNMDYPRSNHISFERFVASKVVYSLSMSSMHRCRKDVLSASNVNLRDLLSTQY
eukprot:CAMPEP_0197050804 /NCGR_PEP_ID=MMETSP1384-20130603/25621_1 /TAXON_ID=29189 /ORGANISM="Ammonia sp." /LENGTH=515 /DNA_ID=CAMNT_0042483263 /DNA_START=58 /DNA_END=1605 /DNA_ORIENTATION=+